MNSKERVALAFAHREADREPIFELTIDNPSAAHVLCGGFLLSSSSSLHPGVVPEYYLAILGTARPAGNYPIR